MDVRSSNKNDTRPKKYENKIAYKLNQKQSSIEIYFIWFSFLIFLIELITDLGLVGLYIHKNHIKWSLITLAIILVPWIVCQLYLFFVMKNEHDRTKLDVVLHILFVGIPYRYIHILRRIERGGGTKNNQKINSIVYKISVLNRIQLINAILQYLPQFLFQSYLIFFETYRCVFSGVSAGLAGFSFAWYTFVYVFYYVRHSNENLRNDLVNADLNPNQNRIGNLPNATTHHHNNNHSNHHHHHHIINNTQSPRNNNHTCNNYRYYTNTISSLSSQPSSIMTTSTVVSAINPNDKNFYNKKQFEKDKIFYFNKRKPIYKRNDEVIDTADLSNYSLEFFEINESYGDSSCLKSKEQGSSGNGKSLNYDTVATGATSAQNSDPNELHEFMLKRKGICSSQEMLHLVDIMNDNITPDQIDMLAKNVADINSLNDDGEHHTGGASSANNSNNNNLSSLLSSTNSGDNDFIDLLDSKKFLDLFPNNIVLDDKVIENIDAAIYENQIIFEKRIHKNQLTIENLKLQDEILSNDIKLCTATCPTGYHHHHHREHSHDSHEYENIFFNSDHRKKYWQSYLLNYDNENTTTSILLNTSSMADQSNTLVAASPMSTCGGGGEASPGKLLQHNELHIDESIPYNDEELSMTKEECGGVGNILIDTINKIKVSK